MVASAPPATQQVTGRVASAGFGASASPARPLMAMRVELLVNSSAWHAASIPTLRWVLLAVLFIYTVSGADCNSRTNDQASRHAFADPGAVRDRRALAVRRRLGLRRKDR